MSSMIWIIIAILFAAFLIMVAVQYCYIKALKEDPRRRSMDQKTYYKNMSFQEEQLHYNAQSSFWPASVVAAWIYRLRHKKSERD